ncbi:MAG: hypothetical protein Q8K12_17305 [Thiobacillus sp.]|nr:hypothetical protein [Thiobacillus sp.]
MLELAALAASAVTVLAPFFQKAGEKAVEKLGESAAGTLYDALKTRLQTPSAHEALEDLAKTPDDADTQAALRIALRKALEQDPALARLLQGLVGEGTGGQAVNITGDGNKTAQVSGTGNKVHIS